MNAGGSEQNRSVANVQSDDLWPSRMHAATHILQEKMHACGVLKRHNFWVHVSLGSAERWDNKSPFNSILSQQHLCQKLPKLVDVG